MSRLSGRMARLYIPLKLRYKSYFFLIKFYLNFISYILILKIN